MAQADGFIREAKQLIGKAVDFGGMPIEENDGVIPQFYWDAREDTLLSRGGTIPRGHERVKELRKMEAEALEALHAERPFTAKEPPRAGPEPQDPGESASEEKRKAYADALVIWTERTKKHGAWERAKEAHEEALRSEASLLLDSEDDPASFAVRPAGRPIHRDVECIRIIIPADKDNIVDRPVRDEDRRRFADSYRRWRESGQRESSMTGTPVEQLPGITKSLARDLAFFEVKTIEQFANVNDGNLSRMGPFTALRQRARDWLAAAKGAAPMEAARAEADRLRNEVETLKRQLKEQGESISDLRKARKP